MFGTFMAPHLVEWYTDIYLNVYGVDTTYTDIILQFNTYLKQMVNGTGFSVFSNIIVSIGIVLMLFYFFSDLAEKAAMNELSMLQMGKSVCAAIATLFVIFHTKQIFIFMLTFIESLNEELADIGSTGYANISAFLNNHIVQLLLSRCVSDHFNIFEIIGYTMTALLLMLVSLVSRVYITYYAATRIIQLFVYHVFAPIGVADVFERGPGGTINWNSSGIRYLKTMAAIMLQVVVITMTNQAFTIISSQVQAGYFTDQGDPVFQTNIGFLEWLDEWLLNNGIKKSAEYPLKNMEYTSHKANVFDIAANGVNKVKEWLLKMQKKLFGGDDSEESGGGPTEEETHELLTPLEKHKVTGVVTMQGTIINVNKALDIENNSRYRMTVDSTKTFFDWCTGSDGSKMVMFIILMATKVLMVVSSSKLCGYVTGISV